MPEWFARDLRRTSESNGFGRSQEGLQNNSGAIEGGREGREGNVTKYLPTGEFMSIYDAAVKYGGSTPLVIIAEKQYGSGSSRDWAAKAPKLLGVKAVIAESFERIHRSNLVAMVVPGSDAKGNIRQFSNAQR